jgi:solute carrier family 13 (sodium-dependent dicarboxylate transporter), member 2/3/5
MLCHDRGRDALREWRDRGVERVQGLTWERPALLPPGARHIAKILGGIVAALAVYALLPADSPELGETGRITAALGILMAIWWMTEAVPLAATALLPLVVLPLAGVGSIGDVSASYADPIIFLFLGGFLIALGIRRSGLHRRAALTIVDAIGVQPARLVAGFMVATGFLSMWISNTAATVMMLPVGISIIGLVEQQAERAPDAATGQRLAAQTATFGTGLMLGIAYAASIGSLATPIGTPPNLFMVGFLERNYGIAISFGRWMAFALPISLVLLGLAWLLLTSFLYKPGFDEIPGGREIIDREVGALGPFSPSERLVLVVFSLTALGWLARDPLTSWDPLIERLPFVERITDAGIAVIGALLLFIIPYDWKRGSTVMNWEAARDVPWNVLLLFGGGLSLASAVGSTGLDRWIGTHLSRLTDLPVVLLVVGITAALILLTELTSNTATAATFLPILAGLAIVNAIDPMLLVVPAALAGTCAFMLPVATPPNAIVFGSGHVTIPQMARTGIFLNLVAVAIITIAVLTLGRIVLGIEV